MTSFLPLLSSSCCFLTLLSVVSFTCECKSWMYLALAPPSWQVHASWVGRGRRSKGVRGLNPYTTPKGEWEVVECITLLYANSMWGRSSSHSLMFCTIIHLSICPKVLLTTSVWPSLWGCDKGLITTKDDGPWHMLRRKGVPWSLPLLLFSLV